MLFILYDITRDIYHKEQMNKVIRNVSVNDEKYKKIKESFLQFIESQKNPAESIANEIQTKLERDGNVPHIIWQIQGSES